jgi:hypothetical protein
MGGDTTGGGFARLLSDFTRSAESGDGGRFARHFTEDAIYYDEPVRTTKVFQRWTGGLRERPETIDDLARAKGSQAKSNG